ncbi:MAG: CHC2 zinc finger domain-containing protein, partial [Methanosarcina sp.]
MQNEKGRDQVDQIRRALDIVDVIGKTVTLRRDSNGVYKGATSTSSKSGASLTVDQNLQIYHDFASRAKGGDVYNWIAYDQGLDIKTDFPEILRIAADMAGIPFENNTTEEKEKIIERQNVRNTLTQAAELYHENLTPDIREYINTKWGITNETVDRIKVGYAKPGNGANLYGVIEDE